MKQDQDEAKNALKHIDTFLKDINKGIDYLYRMIKREVSYGEDGLISPEQLDHNLRTIGVMWALYMGCMHQMMFARKELQDTGLTSYNLGLVFSNYESQQKELVKLIEFVDVRNEKLKNAQH